MAVKNSGEKDYYKILGVEKSANTQTIKKKYRALAREHHPDTNEGSKHSEEKFKLISEAYNILGGFLSIQRFYRYIAIRATPDEAQKFFTEMDVRMGHLALTWHGFDLEKIDAETAEVLTTLKAKRDEIRQRRKNSK